MTIPKLLSSKLLAALEALGIEVPEPSRIQVATAADLRFGDFQSNAAMVLAKAVGKNPVLRWKLRKDHRPKAAP